MEKRRIIKFRAKHYGSERYKNNEWLFGMLLKGDKFYFIQDEYGVTNYADENTIGQYTGLKDKNGKEIYEGDVVLEYDTKYIVRYEPTRGGFFPFACGDVCGCCDDEVVYHSKDVKIIGSIYDNPELLKEE